ncbi:MAG: hypothetical protein JWO58_972 [Chitinophagaceae bacterium]|nr:hypothetical protein [Chitinophagaceae bacterium]
MFVFFARPCAIAFCCCISISFSFAQLMSPGDLVVVVGYNFKDPDEFSLLPLVDLSAGTQFCVTDCGWDATTAAFRPGEGLITFTVPAPGISAGQQIHYPTDGGFVKQGISGFFGLSTAGDQLLVFQGTFQNPQFIFGLSDYDGSWLNPSLLPDNQTSHRPPGLIDGQTSLMLDQYINARFECSYPFADRQEFLRRLTDPQYWIKTNDRVQLPIWGCGFDPLALQAISWNYKMEDEYNIHLSISSVSSEELSWKIYDQSIERELNCQKRNDKEYDCQLPASHAEEIYIKPCISEQSCEDYKKITRSRGDHITWFMQEPGVIRVSVERDTDSYSYVLYDVMGRTVLQEEKSIGSFQLRGLHPGLYILNMELARVMYCIPISVAD